MSDKKINYMSRTYDEVRGDLIKLSNKYYPEMSDSFNDSSVGAWFIDLLAAVSDDLNYHIDRCYSETDINNSNLKSTVMNLARSNGLKVPGNKSSICEVEMSCELIPDNVNTSLPNWNYAPIVKRSSIVSCGPYNYELTEDVDFGQQFNNDGFSNRKFTPKRNSNGVITAYTISKSTIVVGGTTRVYKKVITDEELQPFMEIILPDKDVMNVESIIFKDSSDFSTDPQISEYYYDVEEFNNNTYRYFEVNSLADQYRYGTETELKNKKIAEKYDDYFETDKDNKLIRTTRVYKGEWKPLTQKYITEYTDNGYMKVIFGSGVLYDTPPSGATIDAQYQMCKLINNDMLGVLPKAGWTMYILYRVGGGAETNVAQGAINTISFLNSEMPNIDLDTTLRNNVLKSISVNNISTSVAGKDAPSVDEIKNLIKYNTSSQDRCLTVKDYKARLMTMPPKYGCPFRASVIEENNKILMSLLGVNAKGQLDSSLPLTLVNNIIEYLKNYRTINDYVEIKSGKIYNLGFELDVFIDKNYNTADVIKTIINQIISYMDINKHDIGEDIFIGDLEKSITMIDGVISLIELRVFNIYGGTYSTDRCPLPMAQNYSDGCQSNIRTFFKTPSGADAFEIGLDEIDNVLYSDYNSQFEIFNPSNDIVIRAKLK